jgi:(p)ppGpp synthase/HD superfamily hydrolase
MKTFKQFLEESTAMKAFFYAKNAHKGQSRSDKSPYIKHPARVAAIVKKYKTSKSIDDILSAAYLHDTIEDTKTTERDLKDLFGGLVSSLVKELTSNKEDIEKVGKTQYLLDKMSNMSSWALVIKLADRLDNVSDLRTAKSEAWRNKYKKETIDILNQLEKRRELSSTHKKIIDEIRKKIEEAGN